MGESIEVLSVDMVRKIINKVLLETLAENVFSSHNPAMLLLNSCSFITQAWELKRLRDKTDITECITYTIFFFEYSKLIVENCVTRFVFQITHFAWLVIAIINRW